MGNGPIARRCSGCDTDWPNVTEFDECGLCGAETWSATNTQPLGITEARKLKDAVKKRRENEAAFEEFYVDWAVEQLGQEIEEWGVLGESPNHPRPRPMFDEKAWQKFVRTIQFTPEDIG